MFSQTVITILFSVFTVILGFVLLIKGADAFVSGSSGIAKKLKVPSLLIGLTIVAMGTSLPELAVSVTASLAGSNSLAVSNVTGSNIFNLMVVLGASALFVPIAVDKSSMRIDFPFSVFAALLLLLFGMTGIGVGDDIGMVGRIEGVALLVFFVIFLGSTIYRGLKNRKNAMETEEEETTGEEMSVLRCIIYIVVGAVAIKFGGDFVVGDELTLASGATLGYGATSIARVFGISETLIGLTIVALGTSLPELVTSIVAARKNEVDMAIGNVLGSNIFNIFLIIGVAGAISPIGFVMENVIDLVVLMVMSVLVWLFCKTKDQLDKREGIIMIALYIAYVVYICIR